MWREEGGVVGVDVAEVGRRMVFVVVVATETPECATETVFTSRFCGDRKICRIFGQHKNGSENRVWRTHCRHFSVAFFFWRGGGDRNGDITGAISVAVIGTKKQYTHRQADSTSEGEGERKHNNQVDRHTRKTQPKVRLSRDRRCVRCASTCPRKDEGQLPLHSLSRPHQHQLSETTYLWTTASSGEGKFAN